MHQRNDNCRHMLNMKVDCVNKKCTFSIHFMHNLGHFILVSSSNFEQNIVFFLLNSRLEPFITE